MPRLNPNAPVVSLFAFTATFVVPPTVEIDAGFGLSTTVIADATAGRQAIDSRIAAAAFHVFVIIILDARSTASTPLGENAAFCATWAAEVKVGKLGALSEGITHLPALHPLRRTRGEYP